MTGIIFSIIAGAAMSIQGVWNTRLQEKIGMWETTALVQGIGFVCAIIVALFFGNGNIKAITDTNKLYLLGGVLGIIITFTVMQGMKNMGPTFAVSVILISQLVVAALIDAFGLFGTKQVDFNLWKIAGVGLMIGGVTLFKLK